jgi:hypothetical protein
MDAVREVSAAVAVTTKSAPRQWWTTSPKVPYTRLRLEIIVRAICF